MILEGSDEETLKLGVGHIEETAYPGQLGNIAVVAHRDTFFRPVRRIVKNDEIRVVTSTGTMRYLVESTKIVRPDDTEVLDPTPGAALTLITCFPFDFVGPAPLRFIVRAVAVEKNEAFSDSASTNGEKGR